MSHIQVKDTYPKPLIIPAVHSAYANRAEAKLVEDEVETRVVRSGRKAKTNRPTAGVETK
ncbi:hypothetical protein SEA_HANKAYSHA_14 [Mycobacterium phage HanKaySha]|nr:hypothetical protein SEA_HANKAYSHA_14 [Mycobacterium phage HanKaySha]